MYLPTEFYFIANQAKLLHEVLFLVAYLSVCMWTLFPGNKSGTDKKYPHEIWYSDWTPWVLAWYSLWGPIQNPIWPPGCHLEFWFKPNWGDDYTSLLMVLFYIKYKPKASFVMNTFIYCTDTYTHKAYHNIFE